MEEEPDVAREPYGDRSDRCRVDDGEVRPAVQKGPHRPVRLAQVRVLPAGLRIRGRELGNRQRTQQRHDPADHPDERHERRAMHRGGDGRGDDEDGGRDHRPRIDHHGIEEAELALEVGG